ncbi:MAG: hypothetical protein R2769_07855 [Saprospiraceae bacterium]
MVITVGDFAVNWYTNTIWLGTGEVKFQPNSSCIPIWSYNFTDGENLRS